MINYDPSDPANEPFPADGTSITPKIIKVYVRTETDLRPQDRLLWRLGSQLVLLQRFKRMNAPDLILNRQRKLLRRTLAEAIAQADQESPDDNA